MQNLYKDSDYFDPFLVTRWEKGYFCGKLKNE